jgi:hypothetical protein
MTENTERERERERGTSRSYHVIAASWDVLQQTVLKSRRKKNEKKKRKAKKQKDDRQGRAYRATSTGKQEHKTDAHMSERARERERRWRCRPTSLMR